MSRDLHAEVDAAFDAATDSLRPYGEAIADAAGRRERLDSLRGKTEAVDLAALGRKYPALRERTGR